MAQSDKGEAKEISYDVYLTCRQYSQDKRIARMIEKRLRRFIIPVEYRADYSDSRIRNIYIPQEKHAGVGGLSEGARKALDRSRFLMVVCTPDTKDSTRVNREIEYFLEHHDRDRGERAELNCEKDAGPAVHPEKVHEVHVRVVAEHDRGGIAHKGGCALQVRRDCDGKDHADGVRVQFSADRKAYRSDHKDRRDVVDESRYDAGEEGHIDRDPHHVF